jgi:hypothetical protein
MELQHTMVQRRLSLAELSKLYQIEAALIEPKEQIISFDEKMRHEIDSYNELCYYLADNKPSEIMAIKELSVIDFMKLVEIKQRHKN